MSFFCSSHIHRNHSARLIAVQPSFSTVRCKTLNIFIKACYTLCCRCHDRRFRPCRKASPPSRFFLRRSHCAVLFPFWNSPLSRPRKISLFLFKRLQSAFCNPFAFKFMQEWVGVYPHPRMFLRDFPTFQRSDIQTCPLLLSKLKAQINHAESTLLQVFFLKNLKPFGITTFEKQGEGW